jgi:hypothetical protein
MSMMRVGGYAWYCEVPGMLWVTEPVLAYRLQYRYRSHYLGTAPGWWLTGNGLDMRLAGNRELKAAMRAAAPLMDGTV